MSRANEPSFLAKLACLFRVEGDTATADALVARCEPTSARSISDEDRDRLVTLPRKGIGLDNRGDHEEAAGHLERALLLIDGVLGPDHVDVIEHLNDLARCRFTNANCAAALKDYGRLRHIAERAHGPDDNLVKIARHYVERCQRGLRGSIGALRLQTQMYSMLQLTRGVRSVEANYDQDRVRDIARRLMSRGRHTASVRLYERWIELRLHDAPPDEDLALLDIRDYAKALRSPGKLVRTASVLQKVVAMRNRRSAWDDDKTELLRAMPDWKLCLVELGEIRSATETANLAESIANDRRQVGVGDRE
jgi:tetratricopeptide (TPR) repeat protein